MRNSLRRATAAAHDEVENLYDTLDLTREPDLVHFLMAHHVAVSSIETAIDDLDAGGFGLLPLIRSDLDRLGCRRQPPVAIGIDPSHHPLGLRYVVAGSRLGARILAGRASASPSARVRSATGYLTAARGDGLWRDFLIRSESPSVGPGDQDAIIKAALCGFSSFGSAFEIVAGQMHHA